MASKADRELKLQNEALVLDYLAERAGAIAEADVVRRNRSVTTVAGRESLFMTQLVVALKDAFAGKLARPVKTSKLRGKTLRILNLISSDTHYGSNLDPREVGHKYGPVEEARRTAHIMRQVAGYKRDHRDVTELYWHILGDMIQGQLHDMRDGAPLAEQVAACIRILVQAMRYLSVEFPRGVTIFCTPGNHGRNTARHQQRATNQKWDAIETMIYVALKEAATFLPNVKVVLDYQPEYYWNAFGAVGLGTHGDTVIQPGYPGKSINVEGISRQVDKINNARVMRKETPLSIVIVGHVHTGSMTHLPGGTVVLTNSCLIPPDAYAKSIGIFSTACGQWMWESVPDHPVGDARLITVNSDVDQDESLDAIIRPFTGL